MNKIGSQNANSLVTELKIFIINFPYFALASIFFLLSLYALIKLPIKFKIFEYIFFIGFGILMLIAHDHGRFFAMLFILFFYLKDDIFKKNVLKTNRLNKFLVATLLIFSCLLSFPHYFGLPIIQNSFLALII